MVDEYTDWLTVVVGPSEDICAIVEVLIVKFVLVTWEVSTDIVTSLDPDMLVDEWFMMADSGYEFVAFDFWLSE